MEHISNYLPHRPEPKKQAPKKRGVPKVIFEASFYKELILRDFNKNHLLVLLWVSRYQFGYNRLKASKIAVKMYDEALGISKSTASTTIKQLKEQKVLIEIEGFLKISDPKMWEAEYRKGVDIDNLEILEVIHAREQRKRMNEQYVQDLRTQDYSF